LEHEKVFQEMRCEMRDERCDGTYVALYFRSWDEMAEAEGKCEFGRGWWLESRCPAAEDGDDMTRYIPR